MSKFLKNLVMKDLSSRLEGVNDLLLVDVVGMDANATYEVRKTLREKSIQLLVVRKTLARKVCEGTALAPAFEGVEGSTAVLWGAGDFVDLAKEVVKLHGDDKMKFVAKGGVMDGEALTPERLKEISKWPNRAEQLSLLVGQILGPGRKLGAQIKGPGGKLASQIKKISEGSSEEA